MTQSRSWSQSSKSYRTRRKLSETLCLRLRKMFVNKVSLKPAQVQKQIHHFHLPSLSSLTISIGAQKLTASPDFCYPCRAVRNFCTNTS